MDTQVRKQLVLSYCKSPAAKNCINVASQDQLDAWARILVDAGETDARQIVAAVSFIAKTHGYMCHVEHTTRGLRCIGSMQQEFPGLPDSE